ncbi:phage portal protein [Paraclostridium sordellii]|uniref:phage portal protein n=1 Tax=Paraclostridium sordellii TaxID=1505 RepID=UPI0018CDA9E6
MNQKNNAKGRGKKRIFYSSNKDIANNETIFAAISLISNAVASVPIHLRKGYEKVSANENTIARLLRDGVNPNMTTFEFIRIMEVIRNTKGRAYAIKEYDYYENISYIWILNPDYVTPYKDEESGELWYKVKEEYIHSRHIIEVSHISADEYGGISPIDVLYNTLDYDEKIKSLSVEQLENGIGFRYAFKVGANLSIDKLSEYHELIQEYMDKGIIYLDNGKSLEELKNNSFIDPKVFEVEEITVSRVARVFNIPPHKLSAKNITYSSAEQGDLEFLVDTILPVIRMYEQQFNKKCLSNYEKDEGFEVKFNLNGFARADMKTRGEFYFKMIRSAGLTPNEVRMFEDMPPKPHGDDLLISRDLIPIKDINFLLKGGEINDQSIKS